ncbi:hypothetical protein [Shouchella lonarensis]|uniref:Secreted protein n=1 Tax=Shouchella lonarensis TaxID=1464122 RepID=A0A1G6GZ70_9BACI|nr:hypothetical protein [Shouchella lonarensis]SDB87251.1 hypothetical protein SAMN05421737_102176 [Shouchella lonarensis]
MIKRRVLIGLAYVALVVILYGIITGTHPFAGGMHEEDHKEKDHDQHQFEEGKKHDEHASNDEKEVFETVSYEDDVLHISLADHDGKQPELLETHEKKMHVIVVSRDLQQFHHVHPEKDGAGDYNVSLALDDGFYRAFVDIKPKGKMYKPTANDLHVGSNHTSKEAQLVATEQFEQEIKGKRVTLEVAHASVGKTTLLDFNLHGETVVPYLGALGHVVMLDEAAETLIHVHPTSDQTPVFETHFSQPGLYKLWAEFQFEDVGVVAFPYVIEVK